MANPKLTSGLSHNEELPLCAASERLMKTHPRTPVELHKVPPRKEPSLCSLRCFAASSRIVPTEMTHERRAWGEGGASASPLVSTWCRSRKSTTRSRLLPPADDDDDDMS